MPLRPYTTVAAPAQDEFVERRSRFIGHIAPVTTEEEAMAFLKALRDKHYDARHNVFAFVLRDGRSRFSDDGEPSGTGGKPVMDVITGAGLSDVAVVVTRYFGGVLLGTGGLTHAYSQGASLAQPPCSSPATTVFTVSFPICCPGSRSSPPPATSASGSVWTCAVPPSI